MHSIDDMKLFSCSVCRQETKYPAFLNVSTLHTEKVLSVRLCLSCLLPILADVEQRKVREDSGEDVSGRQDRLWSL